MSGKVLAHLVEPAVKGLDQGFLTGMSGDPTPGRLRLGHPAVLGSYAIRRSPLWRENLPSRPRRDELAVEVARIPVEQHTAQVEHHDRGHAARLIFRL